VPVEPERDAEVERERSGRDQLVAHPGEQLLQRRLAGREQDMAVVALRYPASGRRGVGQLVAVEQQYPVEAPGGGTRHRQTRYPRTDDYRKRAPGHRIILHRRGKPWLDALTGIYPARNAGLVVFEVLAEP